MSKMSDQMRADIASKFGPDGAKVFDYLIDMDTLDDILARRHMVKVKLAERMVETPDNLTQIWEDLADEYCMSYHYVRYISRR